VNEMDKLRKVIRIIVAVLRFHVDSADVDHPRGRDSQRLRSPQGREGMSQKNPYMACARCETFHLASEMTPVPALDATGKTVALYLCRACMHPRTTYIQGFTFPWLGHDVPRTLMASVAAVLVALDVIFALIIGGTPGLALALSAILVGAGILAAVAASCIQSS
jgi:hypothetical protein